ncbi:MAG: ROK family protein [Solobacterium sp.]|nr:ROK family protein [Solobacterium sp.]
MAKASDLKAQNTQLIRSCFFEGESRSLSDIRHMTGLSHGSIVNALRELEENGEIRLHEKTGGSVGRKTYRYTLNPDYLHFGCLSILTGEKGYRFHAKIRTLDNVSLFSETADTERFEKRDILPMLARMMEAWHPDLLLVSSPGVCVNGVIEGETDFDLGQVIRDTWQVPFVIENDVNTAVIGLHRQYPGDRHLALVYQAAGNKFGIGIIIHGRLYNGYSHAAGEVRYLPFMADKEHRRDKDLLKDQILSVMAMLNPEAVAYYSETVEEDIHIEEKELPERYTPQLLRIRDYSSLISDGFYSIGMHIYAGGIK